LRFRGAYWFVSSVVQSIANLSRRDLIDQKLNVLDHETPATAHAFGSIQIFSLENFLFMIMCKKKIER
jgi:hypothetical protein